MIRHLLRQRVVTIYLLTVAFILLFDQLWSPAKPQPDGQLIFISDTDSIDAGRGSNSVYRIGLDGSGMKRIVGSIPHGDGYLRVSDIDCHATSQSLVIASHSYDLNGFHHALLDGSNLHLDQPAAGKLLTGLRHIALAPDGVAVIVSRESREIATPRFGLVAGDLRTRVYKHIKQPTEALSYSWPDWSPDGRQIAYVIEGWADDARATYSVAIAAPDGSDERVIYETTWMIADVTWSPDGEWLASVIGSQVFKFRPDGSDVMRLSNHHSGASSPLWSPTGERISFVAPSSFPGFNQLMLMDADGRNIRQVVNIHGQVTNGCWI